MVSISRRSVSHRGKKGAHPLRSACRVAVHSDDDTFIAVYHDTRIYDYERADGLWSSPDEALEQPAAGELHDE